ncbi:hypothetical protein BDR26DRAFT_849064 [Obelidium mucronatum]|nr:hypothetical protein BDR26DRAFT_849064 [Obelidium mucronatum]
MKPVLALIIKNTRIKRRKWCRELCILFVLPCLLSILAMVLVTTVQPTNLLSHSKEYDLSEINLYFPPGLPYGKLAVAAEGVSSTDVDVLEQVLNHIQFSNDNGVKPSEALVRMSSEAEVNKHCAKAENTCVGGVVFHSAGSNWNYTVMADSFANAISRNWPSGAPSPFSILPFLQFAINDAIIHQNPNISKITTQSHSVSVVELKTSLDVSLVVQSFNSIWSSVFYATMFGPAIFSILYETTVEKENRLKEGMLMMGVMPFQYTASWYITYIIQCLPTYLVAASLLSNVFPTVFRYFRFLPLTMLCGLASLSFALIADLFVSNSKTGPILGVFFMALTILTSNIFLKRIAVSTASMAAISFFFTPAAWTVGLAGLTQPLVPASLLSDATGGLDFSSVCIILVFQNVFYWVLWWYLSQTVPQAGISHKSPFFIFRGTYWFPKWYIGQILSKESTSNQDIEMISETLMKSAKIGISVRNLGKVFRHSYTGALHPALIGLNLDVQKGSVLALLGKNGAGKTTFISILTGLLQATTGDVFINGESALQSGAIRKPGVLGVCPQQDTVFPTLTVTETFQLYAGIKRIPQKGLGDQIEEWLKMTELSEHRNVMAGSLSGGQKRRLAVGVAFLGNPKVVILDEMSSGVDPVSRRRIWEIIQNQKEANKTIIFTTHFLDEAEALADRIAILGEGMLKCVGSLWFLKKEFGAGYNLTVLLKQTDEESLQDLDIVVKSNVSDAELVSFAGAEVQYHLPERNVNYFGQMIRQLECIQFVESFGLSVTTLDEVFMRVNSRNEVKLPGSSLSVRDNRSNISSLSDRVVIVRPPWWRLILVIAHKTWISAFRDKSLLISRTLLPIVAAAAISQLLKDIPSYHRCTYVKADESPSMEALLTPNLYIYPESFASRVPQSIAVKTNVTGLGELSDFISMRQDKKLPPIINITSESSATIVVSSVVDTNQDLIVALQSVATSAFLSKNKADFQIETKVKRLSGPLRIDWNITGFDQLAFILAIFFFGLPGLAGSKILVTERLSGSKFQQYISGTSPLAYWLGHTFIDVGFVTIVSLLVCAIPIIANTPNYGSGGFGWLFLITLSFGLASMSLGHLRAHYATSFASLLTSILTFYFGVGFLLEGFFLNMLTALDAVSLLQATEAGVGILSVFTAICPPFGFFWAIGIYTNVINLRCSDDMTHLSPIEKDIWKPILAMLLQSLLFSTWSIALDAFSKTKGEKEDKKATRKPRQWSIRMCGWFQNFSMEDVLVWQPPMVSSDEDVIAEEKKVAVPVVGDEALVIHQLNKTFGNFEAVKSLSLTVEKGTCFALLGSNGCGKSTTFDVICGKKKATSGSVYLNGWSIANNLSKAHEHMGYCPQVDALQDSHTVEEVICLYARIRGVPESQLADSVQGLMKRLDLLNDRTKLIAHLSGGNRRKVSVAIALVGDPAVILLDEPSTGMDALSKRCVWDAIASIRKDHAIVLTTHSMEEAESISNRMAIMSHGQLRCLGTIQHLRAKFSSDLELDLLLKDARVDVRSFGIPIYQIIVNPIDPHRVRLKVPGSANLVVEEDEIESVDSRPSNLAALFDACEALKSAGVVEEYRIAPASLEQIFMDVIKEAELARQKKKTFGGVVGFGYIRSM